MKKDGLDLKEIIVMNIGTILNFYGNPKMITDRLKADIPMNFMTNVGSKIVYEVGGITGAVQRNSIQR